MSTRRTFDATLQVLSLLEKTGKYKGAFALAKAHRADADRLGEVQTLVRLLGGHAELSVGQQLERLEHAHRMLAQYAEAVGLELQARIDRRSDSVGHWRRARARAHSMAREACRSADCERWIEDRQQCICRP